MTEVAPTGPQQDVPLQHLRSRPGLDRGEPFAGAPYVETAASPSAMLTGITAAVVGVIATLAVYSAVHTPSSRPPTTSRSLRRAWTVPCWTGACTPLVIAAVALALVFQLRWSVRSFIRRDQYIRHSSVLQVGPSGVRGSPEIIGLLEFRPTKALSNTLECG
ncbi:MAG TPA: hypothetical protein VFP00_06925 [Burkholderiales bacterium]|nr:hypothetical protein [Burkholderiales bacterium]